MPTPLTRLDLAELALVAAGLLVILFGLAVIHRRRSWGSVLHLPPQPTHHLELTDLLIGLVAILLLPSIFYRLLSSDPLPPTSAPAVDAEPATPSMVFAMALGQAAGAAIIILISRQRFQNGLTGWGLTWSRFGTRLAQALAAYLAIWPPCLILLHLTVYLLQLVDPAFTPPEHSAIVTLLSDDSRPAVLVVTILSTTIFAPALEELFFRGLLQPALIRWTTRPWLSILLTGVTFGLFHYTLPHTIPALMLFGIALGYVYAKSRSLTLAILLHAVFNAKTLLWLAMGAV